MFWRYWTAATISNLGDGVTTVALPLLALTTLRASAFEVGALTSMSYVAWLLLGLPAGAIIARRPLRSTQVAMDVLRAIVLLSIPIAAFADSLTMMHLLVAAFVIGVGNVVFDIASSTFLPAIVPQDQLMSRNSVASGSYSATQLAGPSVGGVLVQLAGSPITLLIDVGSYLVSAALLRTLPDTRGKTAPADERSSLRAEIVDGARFVYRQPAVRTCTTVATVLNFCCGGVLALSSVFLVRILGAPPGLVGVLLATEGVGSLAAAVVVARWVRAAGSARTLLFACVLAAASSLVIPLTTSGAGLIVFAVGNAGFAAGVTVASIVIRTHRQTVTPAPLLSRVTATVRFVSFGAIPLGAMGSGFVAVYAGPRATLVGVAVCAVLAPVAVVASGWGRRRDLLEPVGEVPA